MRIAPFGLPAGAGRVVDGSRGERSSNWSRIGGRWLGRLGAVVAVAVGMALVGSVYESAAEARDLRAFPPPGQLVDVGGHRLHIDCVGTGSPTVVVDAGWGDWSPTWSAAVQPAVAVSTRVCVYDRAGYGYSDPGPLPRDAERITQELHTLLERAGVPGPYVVVGHSLGGAHVRVFAHEFPADVAGVVLIDSMNPLSDGRTSGPAEAGTTDRSWGDWVITLPARIGAMRALGTLLGLKDGLPPGVREAYAASWVTPRHFQVWIGDEGRAIPKSLAQAHAITSLGSTPLIVVSRGRDQDAVHVAEQANLLTLSSNSQQMIAERSGHNVEVDQPDAAVAAVLRMVDQVRRSTPSGGIPGSS